MSLRGRIATEVNTAGWWIIAEVLTAPVQILAFLVARLLRPVFLVQTMLLIAPHIGHLTANTDIALTEISLQGRKDGTRIKVFSYLSERRVCNQFLLNLIKRRTTVVPRWAIIVAVRLNTLIPGGNVHDGFHQDRDRQNLLDRTGPQFHLTIAETKSGNQKLADIGIPVGAKFVCLNVRDSVYNKTTYPGRDWQFHDYRDCAIENYVAAAEELTRRGYYVFRMGVIVERPLISSNPMIIDYASNGMRSDFMDIFLGANCEFCISHGTGFDGVPYVFRRPILYVNAVPIGQLQTFSEKFYFRPKTWFGPKLVSGLLCEKSLKPIFGSPQIQVTTLKQEYRSLKIHPKRISMLSSRWSIESRVSGLRPLPVLLFNKSFGLHMRIA